MARLIEFFTKPGELVLDPFAGVGGTLLGAAICRAPRRALGFEIEPRWATVYAVSRRRGLARRTATLPLLADLGTSDPGGPRHFDPTAPSAWSATRWSCCRVWTTAPSTSWPPTRRTTPS